jgi:outer membrane protein assembly factor BamB
MKKILLLLGIGWIVLFSCTKQNEISSEWRGPDRQGIFYETGLLDSWPEGGPELLWSFEGLGAGHSSPGIGNNRVFVTGMPDTIGVLYSFDIKGNLLWQKEYGEEWHVNFTGSRSTPVLVNDLLYFISGMGEVFCYNANDGEKVWSVDMLNKFDGKNIRWGISESVLIDGDHLICTPGGEKHNLVALNRFTGETVWSSTGSGEESAYCSPLLTEHNGTRLIITHTAGSVIGIDANTGEKYWRVPQMQTHKIHANTPVYNNGIVYCSSTYHKEGNSGLLALELSGDGKIVKRLFRNEDYRNLMGGIVLLDGVIYGSAYRKNTWYSIDALSGEEKEISSDLMGGVIISAEDLFYCYTEEGELALVKMRPDSFEIISKFKIPLGTDQHWAHPIIHNKRMYIRHGDALMVYDISAS